MQKKFELVYDGTPDEGLHTQEPPIQPAPKRRKLTEPKHVQTGKPNSHGSIDTQHSEREIPAISKHPLTRSLEEDWWSSYDDGDERVLAYMGTKNPNEMLDFNVIDQIIFGSLNQVNQIKAALNSHYLLILSAMLEAFKVDNYELVDKNVFFYLVYFAFKHNVSNDEQSLFGLEVFDLKTRKNFLKIAMSKGSLKAYIMLSQLNRLEYDDKNLIGDYMESMRLVNTVLSDEGASWKEINRALGDYYYLLCAHMLDRLMNGECVKTSGMIFTALIDHIPQNHLSFSVFGREYFINDKVTERFKNEAFQRNCWRIRVGVAKEKRINDALSALELLEEGINIFLKDSHVLDDAQNLTPAPEIKKNLIFLLNERCGLYRSVVRQHKRGLTAKSVFLKFTSKDFVQHYGVFLDAMSLFLTYLDFFQKCDQRVCITVLKGMKLVIFQKDQESEQAVGLKIIAQQFLAESTPKFKKMFDRMEEIERNTIQALDGLKKSIGVNQAAMFTQSDQIHSVTAPDSKKNEVEAPWLKAMGLHLSLTPSPSLK